MDAVMKTIEQIAQEKQEHRRRRAALSFPEKIRIVVELQKRRAPIVKLRGKAQCIWRINGESEQD
jgi:hypothetical protein